jgi:8-oxo-dGTP pyrophosphatase MutT (NUDIX family)
MGKYIDGRWVDYLEKVKVIQKEVVLQTDGRLLTLQRHATAHERPDAWDLPGGSVDEEDIINGQPNPTGPWQEEVLFKALAREISEETGIDIAYGQPVYVHADFDQIREVFVIVLGYLCTFDDEGTVAISEEHRAFRWVTKEEFLQLDVGDGGEYLRKLVARLLPKE